MIKKKVNMVFYAIIIALLFSLAITKINTGSANVFGFKPFVIVSESMEPTIMAGQMVLGKTIRGKSPEIGDILAYRTDSDKIVIHRLIGINDNTYEFKGDNNKEQLESDKQVKTSQILYKIIWY